MTEPLFAPEQLPEIRHRVEPGEIWQVGVHRVGCLDALDPESYRRLMGDERAQVADIDGPWGFSVAEWDRYGRDKFVEFYRRLWSVMRPHLADNASCYMWGSERRLWEWWYRGGMADSPEKIESPQEIVWDKGNPEGMNDETRRRFPMASERCLFWMLGAPTMSTNADQYWEGWEPIRAYLDGERERMGWGRSFVDSAWCKLKGVSQTAQSQKWFTKSCWGMPTLEAYGFLRNLAHGHAFRREYDDIRREWMSKRAPFDNTWDNMRDVWTEPRVTGADRWGHPTPKPVAFARRIAKTSARVGDICLVPFAGSSPWSEAAPMTGRILRTMDIDPRWADVAITRLERWTGLEARRVDL